MVSISEYGASAGANQGGARGTGIDDQQDLRVTRPVRAPHYTELRDHGRSELARIVAAQHRWRLTDSGDLVDDSGAWIARSIETAAAAMDAMGWFPGDGDGEVWIDWEATPEGSTATASAVRSWPVGCDAGEPGRTGGS